MPDLREHLQSLFGLDDFRPAQRGVIEAVLGGKDVLCVMPTGAGKSLCYQLPSAIGTGLTLVVSPLISLMEDQVQQLRDEGVPAMLLNSSLSPRQQRDVVAEIEKGFDGLLYVAPERFFAPGFRPLVEGLKPKLLAVDEAHCISQWGHDFRPEYFRLGEVRRLLGSPVTIALTATATEDVRGDIIRQLGLREPDVVVTGFDRPTLRYESRRAPKAADKAGEMIDLLRNEPGSCIVYCSTRKAVDEVTSILGENLKDRPIFAYHAGMDQAARTGNQERFMQAPRAVAVATNAFGMGINKPDIRLVVHYNIPGTLEAYYQEAGRAGRDGLPARCVILFSYQDRYTQEFFIDKIGEGNDHADRAAIDDLKRHARQKLDWIVRYAQSHLCRRQSILDYFGEQTRVADCRCDVCSRGCDDLPAAPAEQMPEEAVTLIRQLLSAVARCKGNFGIGVVAEVLTGAENERLARWDLNQLTVFGLLRAHSVKRVIAMLHRLLEAGLARQRDPDGVKFRPVVEITASGIAVMKGAQPPPAALQDLLPRRTGAVAGSRPSVRVVPEDDGSADVDPQTLRRFEKLKSVRLEIARERQLPPYCVCHDSTLKLIARHAPADAIALEQIKGMGPTRVRLYGNALLDAVRTS